MPRACSKARKVQRRLDAANNVLKGYISSSLVRGGLNPKPVGRASSKPFWDYSLTLVKKGWIRLWKAAISHSVGSAEAVFLENKAEQV